MSGLYDIAPAIAAAYARRCAKHGTQPYASSHEMLGVLLEEFDEVKDAVRANAASSIDDEVMDVLIVCLHWLNAKGEA